MIMNRLKVLALHEKSSFQIQDQIYQLRQHREASLAQAKANPRRKTKKSQEKSQIFKLAKILEGLEPETIQKLMKDYSQKRS